MYYQFIIFSVLSKFHETNGETFQKASKEERGELYNEIEIKVENYMCTFYVKHSTLLQKIKLEKWGLRALFFCNKLFYYSN